MDGSSTVVNTSQRFKDYNYVFVKNLISKELAEYLYRYTLLKSKAIETMVLRGFIAADNFIGSYAEGQVPGSFGAYGDFAMESLLNDCTSKVEKATGLSLIPTYSYQRTYVQGNELKRHKDRPSCEISATLCLGYDYSNQPKGYNWGMYVEKSGEVGLEGREVCLEQGDAIIYRGCDIEHWRDDFKGINQSQVFLHYNDINGPFQKNNLFDTRPMLGLPAKFKKHQDQ